MDGDRSPDRFREELPRKPREGEPCNGCGLCCAVELCSLAVDLLGASAVPCPAMEIGEGRFWCGLARWPSRYLGTPRIGDRTLGPMVRQGLSIGEGCDAGDPTPPRRPVNGPGRTSRRRR